MQFAVTAGKGVKRVTDYLLQQHHKLSEPFLQLGKGLWSPACKFSHICMRYSINLRKLPKGLKQLLELLQKVICYLLEFILKSKKIAFLMTLSFFFRKA
jgi:hypothetical protein